MIHRRKESLCSRSGLKRIAKRILTAPVLLGQTFRAITLRFRGAQIGTLTFISPIVASGDGKKLIIGDGSYIGRINIQLHDYVCIGNNVVINDGVSILTGTHDVDSEGWPLVARSVVVEDYAWIASGSTLLPGIRIGSGAVVGAGSVVSRDVPAGAIVAGNPARHIRQRALEQFTHQPTRLLAAVEAWLGPPIN